ncbi:LGFP repeat-containing protein [Microbacterium sp. NPDC055521]
MKTSLAGFDPGNIIGDAVFTDRSTMTEAQIQTFFNSKVKTCQAGYTCLKDYKSDSVNRPADVYCKGYMGARGESAARIIHRVAQACGINPQVLIVMLQKEQGLITHTWPSKWRYDAALGQACPDTAPCDPKFVGFFHQIYGAARQMQIYMEGRYFQWYQAGKTWQIQYHPDRERCGTGPVYIANKATEALYYYTPYQPNAAAMRAGYGTGDSCSSYGNRNFYNYFTDWFGSTQGGGQPRIDEAYVAAGGKAVLGAGVSGLSCPNTAVNCWPQYEKGSIYWSIGTGATVVLGDIDSAFRKSGGPIGPLGYPLPGVYTYPQNGGGKAQDFQKGSIFSSASGAYWTVDRVRRGYFDMGGSAGSLGWPTTSTSCSGARCSQMFQFGGIYDSGSSINTTSAQIHVALMRNGGPAGRIGWPVSGIFSYPENGGGIAQDFQNSTSIFSSSVGAFPVADAIRRSYFDQGGASGALGWPTSDLFAYSENGGGTAQDFQNSASIYASAAGAFPVTGAIRRAYFDRGGASGDLGWPTSGIFTYSENGGGVAQDFQNSSSIFASSSGAFAVSNVMRRAYFDQGGAAGPLGWPTSGASCADKVCEQSFQGGAIRIDGEGFPVSGAILQLWQSVRGSSLGAPTTKTFYYAENGGGTAQDFQGTKSVYASKAGAFIVESQVRKGYFAERGAVGPLGWPTAAAVAVTGGVTQAFQSGAVYAGPSGAFGVMGKLHQAYVELGSFKGALGWPASRTFSYPQNGGGTAQDFSASASIYSSSAGAFAVNGVLRRAYFDRGGAAGALGWPVSVASCTGGICRQQFQFGVLYVSESIKAAVVGSSVDLAYHAQGGPKGTLGWPAGQVYSYPQNGGGTAQDFSNQSSIYASKAGSFVVSGSIRRAYFDEGGSAGRLGWPISTMTCAGGVCEQKFQGGVIKRGQ